MYSARYLGTQGFGILSFAVAFTALFATISDLGLNTLTIREVARDTRLASKYLGNLMTLKAVLVGISFSTIVIAVNVLDYPRETILVVYLIALSSAFSAFSSLINAIFQAFERMQYQSIGTIMSSTIMLTGTFTAIGLRADVVGFGFIYLLSTAAVFLYSLAVCICRFAPPKIEADLGFWKKTMLEVVPLAVGMISVAIYYNISSVLLSLLKGDVEVGLYSAAFRLTLIVLGLGAFYHTAMFPALSRLFKEGAVQALRSMMADSARLLAVLGFLVAIVCTFFSARIIETVYGSQFEKSELMLQILIWNVVIIWVSMIFGQALMATNRQRQWSVATVVAGIFNLLTNLALIPMYGIVGAAVASITTEALAFVLVFHFTLPELRLRLIESLARPILAASVAVATGVVLIRCSRLDETTVGLLTLGIYTLSIFVTKSLTSRDIRFLLHSIGSGMQ